MAIESGTNHLIVKINPIWIKDLSLALRMSNMNVGSQINPADYVNITGEVVAVPRTICLRPDYKGFNTEGLKVGDKVIFSYLVVYNFEELPNEEFRHRNEFQVNGKYYWMADIRQIFCYIRDGQVHMMNDYVMLRPVDKTSPIITLGGGKKVRKTATEATIESIGAIKHGSKRLEVEAGDEVLVDYGRIQHYKLGDQRFAIINSKHIYAKV